nr:uncharacterized protein LOC115260430 [Aedes albopictus]
MEDGAVEVRLFDLSNDVTNVHIAEFLAEYGDVLHIRDLLWDERSAFGGVKTGVRIARMVVKKNIPSLVTIRGEDTANKKLLAQKLVADKSYANVAKQPAPTKRADPNNPPQKVLSNSSQCSNAVTTGTRAPPKLNTMPPPANKPSGPPPDIPTAPLPSSTGILNTTRNSDGNDTDSSHVSCSSNSSRRLRSKRSPPGKKMRRNDEANNEHGRGSQEEMQLGSSESSVADLDWPGLTTVGSEPQEEQDRDQRSIQEEQDESEEELHSCEKDDDDAGREQATSGSSAAGKRSTRGTMPSRFNDYVVDIAMAVEAEPTNYGEAVAGPEKDLQHPTKHSQQQTINDSSKNGASATTIGSYHHDDSIAEDHRCQ